MGLWSRKADSIATPDRKKQIYGVFQKADTPELEKAFEFALPVVGRGQLAGVPVDSVVWWWWFGAQAIVMKACELLGVDAAWGRPMGKSRSGTKEGLKVL